MRKTLTLLGLSLLIGRYFHRVVIDRTSPKSSDRDSIISLKKEEFRALRGEIDHNLHVGTQLIYIGSLVVLAQLGAVLASGAFDVDAFWRGLILLTTYPLSILAVIIIFCTASMNIRTATLYIYLHVEKPIDVLLGDEYRRWLGDSSREYVLGWESLNEPKRLESLRSIVGIWICFTGLLIIGSGLGAAMIWVSPLPTSVQDWPSLLVLRWGVSVIPLVVLVYGSYLIAWTVIRWRRPVSHSGWSWLR